MRRRLASAMVLTILFACAGDGRPAVTTALEDGAITVASFNFSVADGVRVLNLLTRIRKNTILWQLILLIFQVLL